jgi:hypothetical protein
MVRALIVAAALAMSFPAQGPQPVDALRTCVADNTSGKDRKDLARWVFLAIGAHPEMKQHFGADATRAADESSRTMAALVTRLLTDSCANETRAVVKAGQGQQSMQVAFQGLGQLAMQELMTDKSVQESMSLFERYLDQKRLAEVMGGK